MMNGTYRGKSDVDPAVRVVRRVGPWVVLVVILALSMVFWSGFQAGRQRAALLASAKGSEVATPSTEASASVAVTGTIAVTRVAGVSLYASPDTRTPVIVKVKKGTKLKVLSRSDAWLRVQEPKGHIGWTANSSKSVEVRKK